MKLQKNKGFTIVELVIVIAVIAVLAAVLIPTFSGVVEKANYSAALQEATNQYKNDVLNYSGNGCVVPDNMCYKAGDYYFRSVDGALVNCTDDDCIKEYLNGKNLSILGDSISTWAGISNNNDYANNLNLNANYYNANFSGAYFNNDYLNTYWGRLLKDYKMELCVNNSWSGSYCSKHKPNQNDSYTPDADGWYNSNTFIRASNLTNKNGTIPDIIIFYIGMNDANVSIDKASFINAYQATLDEIKENYPNAIVFCINQPDRTGCGSGSPSITDSILNTAKAYNEGIEELLSSSEYSQFYLVDQYNFEELKGIKYKNHCVGDPCSNIHLDSSGHELLEKCIVEAIKDTIIKDLNE